MSILQRITTSPSTSYLQNWYWASDRFLPKTVVTAADRYTVLSPAIMQVDVGGTSLTNLTQQTLDLSLDTNWDHGQGIGTWTANHAYSVGDLVRPTAAWLADGANNASTAYATDKMLSNTIPGPGVVGVDAYYSGQFGSYLFSQSTSDLWWVNTAYPHYVTYDFGSGNTKVISKFRYYGYPGLSPKTWVLQGSNVASPGTAGDSTDWNNADPTIGKTLYTGTDIANPGNNWTSYFTFSNSTAYRHYRLYMTVGWSAVQVMFREIHLVSTPSLVYRCSSITTGISGGTSPAFPATENATVTDSGVTWTAYLDNTVAVNRKGQDYYVYACTPTSGTTPKLLLSKQSTYPLGYTASNSRKIGGFHCLCEYVGANTYGTTAHSLYGYVAGDVLPQSVWDLRWKSNSLIGNVGQVYDAGRQIWCAIYHPSGTSTAPTIVLGGTILDTIDWNNSVDACAVLGMRLARDSEFQSIAAGSNERTNIYGSADPVTAQGAVDTAGTRMISNIGVEGACGQMYQWIDEQSYQFAGAASHTHAWTVDGNAQSNIVSAAASGDLAPAWGWQAASGSKGSIYKQGTYGDVKLLSGGLWNDGSLCGSRNRGLFNYNHRWHSGSQVSFRPVARHIVKEVV